MKSIAEANGVKAVSNAIAEANNNPQLVQLKQIEVDKMRAEKWCGKYPDTIVGAGANTWVGLNNSATSITPVASNSAPMTLEKK
jgi:hypothetical protein